MFKLWRSVYIYIINLFLYFFFCDSSWFGCKWTMAISFVAYMPFIAAQFYPKIYTLIPAGLMVGFGGGPLWCAKCTYLTVVGSCLYFFMLENVCLCYIVLFYIIYICTHAYILVVHISIINSSRIFVFKRCLSYCISGYVVVFFLCNKRAMMCS